MLSLGSLTLLALSFFAATGNALHRRGSSNHAGLNVRESCPDEKVASAWWPGYDPKVLPLDKVNWKKYTQLTFAFALTTPTPGKLDVTGGEDLLSQFASTARKNNVKSLISIGGWTGSRFFSTAVGCAANRTMFVKTITDLVSKHHLDGVDFDWEYPNHQGIGCNTISPQDTPNFLALLTELRAHPVGKNLILAAAAPLAPWPDANGNPSNIAPFAKLLDFITIMNYDVWGSWSTAVGPNAPLNDACAPAQYQQGSAVSAIKKWTSAGLPIKQLALGVAAYGRSFSVEKSVALDSKGRIASYPKFESKQPKGDSTDSSSDVDVCGVKSGYGGAFNFWGLVEGKFLGRDGKPLQGIHYRFDKCSKTPYVYNAETQVMVSFDDAKAFEAKGEFIKSSGLRGYVMWKVGGDYDDILIDAIRKGAGYD